MKKLWSLLLGMLLTVMAAQVWAFDMDKEIVVVSREEGSGTRGAFVELTGVESKDAAGNRVDQTYEEALIQKSTQEVLTMVAANPQAIGYVSMASLSKAVKALAVDGVEATNDNIVAGRYRVARPFLLVSVGEKSGATCDFMDFLVSDKAQKVIAEHKAISVQREEKAYRPAGSEGKVVVGGSSSVSPLMEKLIETYGLYNDRVQVELLTTDSSTGVKGVLDGSLNVGMASRELKDSEKEKGAQATVLAMDGIAVIVHPDNPVSSLSLADIRQVFTGEKTLWNQVGQ